MARSVEHLWSNHTQDRDESALLSAEMVDLRALWTRFRARIRDVAQHLLSADVEDMSREFTGLDRAGITNPAALTPLPSLLSPRTDAVSVDVAVAAPEPARRWMVFSDTDNEVEPMRYALWLTGLCDRRGHWKAFVRNVTVIHTGDWINKWDPDPYAIDFLKRLQESAPETCRVILLNGNHEISLLRRMDAGESLPLAQSDSEFIRRQSIIHVERDTLFVHGYPTLDLLGFLQQLLDEHAALNDFNDRFRRAFFHGAHAWFRQPQGFEMLGDLPVPITRFYAELDQQTGISKGMLTGSLLSGMGIRRVIHGHKPNDAVQQDHELGDDVPGIRFINNDNRVRKTGLGGLLLLDDMETVEFINMRRLQEIGGEINYRQHLRRLARTRKRDRVLPAAQ
jgi:hypothetical protein